ncbi:sulfur carrier protein ThiS [Tatumella terrea]|uniref:Sulfur carrier protein ThiS n=1 Tax=Tatumella terrea TaxID=419007 RepID=A0ABW1W4H4_9GAMM
MEIKVNDNVISVEPSCPVSRLLNTLSVTVQGTALAVNERIIPASEWSDYRLQENDDVVIFQVIAGG